MQRHRDAEVLSLFAAIISKLREGIEAEVPRIFEAVFERTLQMITKNFEAWHGNNLSILSQAVPIKHYHSYTFVAWRCTCTWTCHLFPLYP